MWGKTNDLFKPEAKYRGLCVWLSLVCLLVLVTVIVGGITRLTNSGLSMVEWKPIMGALPPANQAGWVEAFEKYKAYPQFKKINPEMNLEGFKFIFFWEYLHRNIGRFIGLFYFFPMLYFLRKKTIPSAIKSRVFIGFLLGGAQGLMGWYMVQSGLVDIPTVSHFRLAAHLGLAFFIFAYLFWLILDLVHPSKLDHRNLDHSPSEWTRLRLGAKVLLGIVSLQIIYGAFTAGLDAGYSFSTFPKMSGQWVPDGLMAYGSSSLISSPMGVQFIHRWLGVGVLFGVLFLLFQSFRIRLYSYQKKAIYNLGLITLFQVIIGILTLVKFVPVGLAVLHQTGALLLLGCLVYLIHALNKGPMQIDANA